MASKFVVRYGTVVDALGRKREGWLVLEDGRAGYPYKTKEEAVEQANATAQIRIVGGVVAPVVVIN
jgi:hypothetical protein